ncbi:epidermal growth factor receptor kinase substrate 8-like isoform X3 [Convolutriloba macropyga]|uniref:epidermal growth factor receptor kinase substrate 8-like isoform X3 n=1 Tax=Convolutriloba macropyga TaxID=536237 RepID=UPI003F523E20
MTNSLNRPRPGAANEGDSISLQSGISHISVISGASESSGYEGNKNGRLSRGNLTGKALYMKRKQHNKKFLKDKDSSLAEFEGSSRSPRTHLANGDTPLYSAQTNYTPAAGYHIKEYSYSSSSGGDSGIRMSSSAHNTNSNLALNNSGHHPNLSMPPPPNSSGDEYEIRVRANGAPKGGNNNKRSASASRTGGRSTDEDMDNNFTLIYNDGQSLGVGSVSNSSHVASMTSASSMGFVVEHLTSFDMSRDDALWTVDDAIRKLKLQDVKNKIWSQEMRMFISRNEIRLHDINTGESIDHFPYSGIAHVESVVIRDYHLRSVLAVIYTDMSGRKPVIFLFHCDQTHADDIADEIKQAMDIYQKTNPKKYAKAAQKRIPPPHIRNKMRGPSSLNSSQQLLTSSGGTHPSSPMIGSVNSRSTSDLTAMPPAIAFYNPATHPNAPAQGHHRSSMRSVSTHNSASPANSQAKRSNGRLSEPEFLDEYDMRHSFSNSFSHAAPQHNAAFIHDNGSMPNGMESTPAYASHHQNHQHITHSYHANGNAGGTSLEGDLYKEEEAEDVVDNLEDTLVGSTGSSVVGTSSQNRSDRKKEMNARMNRQVDILNHCFDDIEAFAQKLKHVHDAQKELEARKLKKKSKQKQDNMLEYRAKMPPQTDFIDAFQKFKLAFNLLSPLKKLISNPSAPELVHHLFPPLSRILDSGTAAREIAQNVYSPLLSQGAVQLLKDCLSTDEKKLWNSLGNAWNIPREKWPAEHYVPGYVPAFLSGWKPPPLPRNAAKEQHQKSPVQSVNGGGLTPGNSRPTSFVAVVSQSNTPVPNRHSIAVVPPPAAVAPSPSPALKSSPPSTMVVTTDFVAGNYKELTVRKGEMLEIMDCTRNWWAVKNTSGQTGYVPNTILASVTDPNSQNVGATTTFHHHMHNVVDSSNKLMEQQVLSSTSNIRQGAVSNQPQIHQQIVAPAAPPPPAPPAFMIPAPPPPPPPQPVQQPIILKPVNKPKAKPAPPPQPSLQDSLQDELMQRIRSGNPFKSSRTTNVNKKEDPKVSPKVLKSPFSDSDSFSNSSTPIHLQQTSSNGVLSPVPEHVGVNAGGGSSASVINYSSSSKEVSDWLESKGFSRLTVDSLGVLSGSQLFSLSKDDLMEVCFQEGHKVYSFVTVQKSLANSSSAATSSTTSGIASQSSNDIYTSGASGRIDPLTHL